MIEKNKIEKIFIDENGNLKTFPCDIDLKEIKNNKKSYYDYIKTKKQENFNQYLFCFDTMLRIILILSLEKNFNIEKIYSNDFIYENNNNISLEKIKYDLSYFCDWIFGFQLKHKYLGSLLILKNGIFLYQKDVVKEIFLKEINKIWLNKKE